MLMVLERDCYLVMEVNGNGNAMVKKERTQEMEMEKLKRDGIGTRDGKITVKDQNGKIGK